MSFSEILPKHILEIPPYRSENPAEEVERERHVQPLRDGGARGVGIDVQGGSPGAAVHAADRDSVSYHALHRLRRVAGWTAFSRQRSRRSRVVARHRRPQLAISACIARKAMNIAPVVRPWTSALKR